MIVDHIHIFFSIFQASSFWVETILIIPSRHKVSVKHKKTNKTNEAEQNADFFFILFVSAEKLIWRTSRIRQSLHLNRQPNMPQTSIRRTKKMFIFGMLKYDFLDFYSLFPFFVLFSWEIGMWKLWNLSKFQRRCVKISYISKFVMSQKQIFNFYIV